MKSVSYTAVLTLSIKLHFDEVLWPYANEKCDFYPHLICVDDLLVTVQKLDSTL